MSLEGEAVLRVSGDGSEGLGWFVVERKWKRGSTSLHAKTVFRRWYFLLIVAHEESRFSLLSPISGVGQARVCNPRTKSPVLLPETRPSRYLYLLAGKRRRLAHYIHIPKHPKTVSVSMLTIPTPTPNDYSTPKRDCTPPIRGHLCHALLRRLLSDV